MTVKLELVERRMAATGGRNARREMQTRIQELPVTGPALAGGLAVLGGVALWQLGIGFERAWLRSYDGPLEGETLAGEPIRAAQGAETAAPAASAAAERERRWVKAQQQRRSPRVRTS
jgi:hypothetical protein